jgi:putative OmpL-like beta-barrel porin-2
MMRFRVQLLAAVVVAGGIQAPLALADSGLQQPPGVSQASFLLDETCGASCEAVDCSNQCGSCCGCSSSCGSLFADLMDPYLQTKEAIKNCYGIDVGGWVQAGMTANFEDPQDRYNGPMLTNDRVGDLQMNQLWLYAHKPVDTGGCGIDIGGRFDMFYGTDWRAAYFHGFGMEDRLNGPDELYGLSIPQMYLEVAVNDLNIRMGRMTGILGYEIAPPMGNFFYSHSYALCYGEPILITGLMSDYQVNEQLKIMAGFHQGVHQYENSNDEFNVQAGLSWTSKNERLSLAYAFDVGRNNFMPGAFFLEEEYLHSLVLKYQATERLLYVIQNDYGYANAAPGREDADWYGINQHLLYALGEKWSAGMRIEWFRDDDGTRVLGLGNLANAQGWDGLPGFNGSFTELTLGLNWKPKANILVRPEARWDWYSGSTNLGGELPFDDGNSSSQFTIATDVVIMF